MAKQKRISFQDFLTAYCDAKDLKELSEKTGLDDKKQIDQKISQLRSKGVNIKTLVELGWAGRVKADPFDKEKLLDFVGKCNKSRLAAAPKPKTKKKT